MTDTPQQWWYVFDEQTRILVVDDDPILREFASVYLTTPMSTVALAPDALLEGRRINDLLSDVLENVAAPRA